MNIQAQRDLQLLNEVERNAAVTQRSLARNLGVAVGLANLYLKRLVRKGHIKITTIPKHRIKYLLTPRGMAEKSRLTRSSACPLWAHRCDIAFPAEIFRGMAGKSVSERAKLCPQELTRIGTPYGLDPGMRS